MTEIESSIVKLNGTLSGLPFDFAFLYNWEGESFFIVKILLK